MAGRQVVVGYDGSPSSRLALTWGMRAAQARRLPVLIAHAGYTPTAAIAGFVTSVDPNPEALRRADEEMLAEAAVEAHRQAADVEVRTRAVPGPAVPVLLELMADAELGVVGHRGVGRFAELLVGSTSLQLASHGTCPLVVVRSADDVEPGPQAGRVVVGLDGSAGAAAAAGFAFQEARLRGCGLTAVHAWDSPALDVYDGGPELVERLAAEQESHAREWLADWSSDWARTYPDVDVRRRLDRDDAARALVGASAGAALLVVGSRGLGGFRALVLGSVSHAVLHHAHSAVAVVHPAG